MGDSACGRRAPTALLALPGRWWWSPVGCLGTCGRWGLLGKSDAQRRQIRAAGRAQQQEAESVTFKRESFPILLGSTKGPAPADPRGSWGTTRARFLVGYLTCVLCSWQCITLFMTMGSESEALGGSLSLDIPRSGAVGESAAFCLSFLLCEMGLLLVVRGCVPR